MLFWKNSKKMKFANFMTFLAKVVTLKSSKIDISKFFCSCGCCFSRPVFTHFDSKSVILLFVSKYVASLVPFAGAMKFATKFTCLSSYVKHFKTPSIGWTPPQPQVTFLLLNNYARGLLTWPNKDDRKWPCNMTENAEDCKRYIFYLFFNCTVNVTMRLSMTENEL